MNLCALAVLLGLTTADIALRRDAANSRELQRSITVIGSGEVSARPDMAEIHAGVMTQAESAAEALDGNNAAMERVVTAVTTVGIAEKDVQTSQFSIVPYHKPDPHGREQPEVAGYRVTNEVQLKVRALTSLGRVLDELVGAGANQMHGISFSVAEPSAPLDDARKKAMADAKRRAELYAQAAEVKLGRVLLIQEQPPSVPRPQMLRFALRAEADAAVPVAPGENKFHASITVTYSIE